MAINQNDNSAEIYDIIFDSLKPQSINEEEISLITSKLEPGAKILDVGGGTGRHALILANLGYEVTVIDSSEGMITNLLSKAYKSGTKIKTINKDIFEVKLKNNEYDMCVLFWNSFNEIALNKKHALKLLRKLTSSLAQNGTILINIDDSKKVDPSSFNFSTLKILEGKEYRVHWETVEYHKKSNTSISKEYIEVLNNEGNVLEQFESYIKQRYWRLEEIRSLCDELGLKLQKLKIKQSDELYLEIF